MGLADAGGDLGWAGAAAALVGGRQAADRARGFCPGGACGVGGAGHVHELNAEMVRLGWALAYRPGNDPFPRPEYEPEEAEARAAGRGMWRGTFIPPWEWRHR